MNDIDICSEIRRTFGAQFVCSRQGIHTRVDTPYLYPDGDYISVFCKTSDDAVTVTDLAETVSWLWMQSATRRLSPKQNQLIRDTCVAHGVEFRQGMLQARCKPGEPLGETLTRVSQAAIRVSDLWFMSRAAASEAMMDRPADRSRPRAGARAAASEAMMGRSAGRSRLRAGARTEASEAMMDRSIVDEVAHYLTEINRKYERDRKVEGKSGRSLTMAFLVYASRGASSNAGFSLIHVVSAGNRAWARRKCDQAVAVWYDLEHAAGNCISLFDDTADIWKPEDYQLLEKLSQVVRWSRREELAQLLPNGA